MPKHSENKRLAYGPDQLFDLVADVGTYQDFLPWCVGSRVTFDDGRMMLADLVIGYKAFREKFTSRVSLQKPDQITVEYLDGPFKYLINHWKFLPHESGGTTVDFFVDFAFKNKIYERAIGPVFTRAAIRMVNAFEDRATALYGSPSLEPLAQQS